MHLALKLIENENIARVEPMIEIVLAEAKHLRLISGKLREADKREILGFGITPEKALWISWKRAVYSCAAFIDGEIAAVWGVGGSLMGQIGTPWLLTSDAVYKISPLKFTRIYQKELKKMLNLFPVLENYVDSGYNEAVRLLEIVGFTIGKPEPIGQIDALFRKFRIES